MFGKEREQREKFYTPIIKHIRAVKIYREENVKTVVRSSEQFCVTSMHLDLIWRHVHIYDDNLDRNVEENPIDLMYSILYVLPGKYVKYHGSFMELKL